MYKCFHDRAFDCNAIHFDEKESMCRELMLDLDKIQEGNDTVYFLEKGPPDPVLMDLVGNWRIPPPTPVYIMITTGMTENGYHFATENEVVPLTRNESRKTCQIQTDESLRVELATGGFLGGAPIVCGGDDKRNYCVDPRNAKKRLVTMTRPRNGAASLVIHDGKTLWISGGHDQNANIPLKSTEFIKTGVSKAKAGPNMPIARQHHCSSHVNGKTVMVAGGRDQDTTHFYDMSTEKWTEGPKLNNKRYMFSCGKGRANFKTGGRHLIVAAGGRDGVTRWKTTEVLLINGDEKQWIDGPDLPEALSGGSVVAAPEPEERLFFIGGYTNLRTRSKSILELTCPEDGGGKKAIFKSVCKWTKLEQQLMHGRSAFVAMLVPESYYTC